jgi:hypothetical protein
MKLVQMNLRSQIKENEPYQIYNNEPQDIVMESAVKRSSKRY